MTKLIEANTTIPARKTETFSTAADNQPSVEIHVLQGERPMAAGNKTIGRFHLDGIPSAPRGVPQIEVTFDIDANGILKVSAKDRGTGKEQSIRIEASSGLTDSEIERMKKEAEANAEADRQARERVDKLNQADSLIFQTEKQMKEFGDKLPADKKSAIESALASLKEAHKAQDLEAIDKAINDLNTVFHSATEEMYRASQQAGSAPGAEGFAGAGGPGASSSGGPGGAGAQSGASSGTEGEVTDVDFEEVK